MTKFAQAQAAGLPELPSLNRMAMQETFTMGLLVACTPLICEYLQAHQYYLRTLPCERDDCTYIITDGAPQLAARVVGKAVMTWLLSEPWERRIGSKLKPTGAELFILEQHYGILGWLDGQTPGYLLVDATFHGERCLICQLRVDRMKRNHVWVVPEGGGCVCEDCYALFGPNGTEVG